MRDNRGISKALKGFSIIMVLAAYIVMLAMPCMAAETTTKADLSAISGFGKNYTSDTEGNFEIEGVMVVYGSVYNITVEDGKIQAWSGKYKSTTWRGDTLVDLLNDPRTLFYGSVKGNEKSAEFLNKVEFTRPDGNTF